MNRRNCTNCQTTWNSLADEQLEGPHTCPRCGDQLTPLDPAQPESLTPLARTTART